MFYSEASNGLAEGKIYGTASEQTQAFQIISNQRREASILPSRSQYTHVTLLRRVGGVEILKLTKRRPTDSILISIVAMCVFGVNVCV